MEKERLPVTKTNDFSTADSASTVVTDTAYKDTTTKAKESVNDKDLEAILEYKSKHTHKK